MSGESGSSSCSSLRIVPSISAAKESWGKPEDTGVSGSSNALALKEACGWGNQRRVN